MTRHFSLRYSGRMTQTWTNRLLILAIGIRILVAWVLTILPGTESVAQAIEIKRPAVRDCRRPDVLGKYCVRSDVELGKSTPGICTKDHKCGCIPPQIERDGQCFVPGELCVVLVLRDKVTTFAIGKYNQYFQCDANL